ncbi:MAG: hypothetical protein AAGE52_32985 [Myxococcota bacterium]
MPRLRFPSMTARSSSLALACLLLVIASPSSAQLEHPAVRDARMRLVPYGPTTLDALADLGRVIEEGRRYDQMDARYLRAVAATDLLVLGRMGTGASSADLAAALGVGRDELLTFLRSELQELAVGPYEAESVDALHAVELLQGEAPAWTEASTRRAVLGVLSQVAGSEFSVSDLAGFGEDPCARNAACGEPWSYFDEAGRRAIDALQHATGTLRSLAARAEAGLDPLAIALAERIPALEERLATIELRPAPNWQRALRTPTVVSGSGDPCAADVVVLHVDPHKLRLVPRPRVRLENGEPVLVAPPQEHPLPLERRAFITPMSTVTEWLTELGHASIALSVDPETPSLTLWQVIASVEAARTRLDQIAVVDDEGRLRTRRVRVEDEAPAGEAQVYVRLGGYSVRTHAGRSVVLPRTMSNDGWVHDQQGLRQAVGRRRGVSYRIMNIAPARLLLHAVFTPEADRATLVRH